jgi:primosomal replication protein N
VKAVAIGAVAERIQTQPIGSVWKFSGFLATPKNGKNVILHIQEFKTL